MKESAVHRRAHGEAILAALAESDRAAVVHLLARLGLPPEAWHAVPGLAPVVESLAVLGEAEANGVSVEEACWTLGVDPAAHRVRIRRWIASWCAELTTCRGARGSGPSDWARTQSVEDVNVGREREARRRAA